MTPSYDIISDTSNVPVAVAVSGGRDSLLALVLAQRHYASVIAVHAFFQPPNASLRQTADALSLQCAQRGIPFHAVDLSREFERNVVQPFTTSYAAGQTPNPCALCNRTMKFGLLMDVAASLGAERLVTGHYARLALHTQWGTVLQRGDDEKKEQSYFLTLVPPERLARAVFPLADWHKVNVGPELDTMGLVPPVAAESREICFVPGDDYRAFLTKRKVRLSGPGDIVLSDGTILGKHQGLWRHTIGQRKGLGVAYSEPLYVLGKDIARNRLVVGIKSQLQATTCHAVDVNLLVDPAHWPQRVAAQTCYRQKPRPASVVWADGRLSLTFEEPVTRPTPGQIAAVYTLEGTALAGGRVVEWQVEPTEARLIG
ncbi:tRNA 2-thiouridine(34) synthase MnmA [Desulfovibrio inopinatus]|uniref:tRNA 2-thiouridine(34) synthase MnmA n=1 Tax=Desulfovibrio inopinatus TaxID=102109 RepID=UPI0003F8413A|nr:tRNA 2-thiouridine(34) synthase MnmA [Desulfovibrio inopinatus]